MTSASHTIHNTMDNQQPVSSVNESSRVYTVLTDIPLATNGEILHEQQIVYYNPPANGQTINNHQGYLYPYQLLNNQIVNQYTGVGLTTQQQHQHQQPHTTPLISMSNTPIQPTMIHSNMNQQQAVVALHHPSVNITAPSYPSMTNPYGSSTPMSAPSKRGRNDTSGLSETNVQLRPEYPQTSRNFYTSNTNSKRPRTTNQQTNERIFFNQQRQNQPVQPNQNANENCQLPSVAACRYAASRYPFSPFSVIFTQEVREKIVVDDLINHALTKSNFELKTIAYRRGKSENNEHRILIFVENAESFAFLYDNENWPALLSGCQFIIKKPSIPPQLSLVIPGRIDANRLGRFRTRIEEYISSYYSNHSIKK